MSAKQQLYDYSRSVTALYKIDVIDVIDEISNENLLRTRLISADTGTGFYYIIP